VVEALYPLDWLVEQINIASNKILEEHPDKWYKVSLPFSKDGVKAYLAVLLRMCLYGTRRCKNNWRLNAVPKIARIMGRDRWLEIHRCMSKVPPLDLMQLVNDATAAHWDPYYKVAVDETMVAFHGRKDNQRTVVYSDSYFGSYEQPKPKPQYSSAYHSCCGVWCRCTRCASISRYTPPTITPGERGRTRRNPILSLRAGPLADPSARLDLRPTLSMISRSTPKACRHWHQQQPPPREEWKHNASGIECATDRGSDGRQRTKRCCSPSLRRHHPSRARLRVSLPTTPKPDRRDLYRFIPC